ncbi:DNA-binding protein [Listeria monocytogenes]|nr:DNA-binding protein [Listeria monocytogenes]GAT38258.1 DNA-binding protein [Listeria monocytogenes]GAT40273.1 DNA-binding protein [Listeria monocytogenes]
MLKSLCSLFNSFFKRFTRFESWYFTCRDVDFFFSTRVTTFTGSTFTYFKVTKSD